MELNDSDNDDQGLKGLTDSQIEKQIADQMKKLKKSG
jgi:hypothetical protein